MKKINEAELQELFNRLKRKEENAYEELYQKYSSLVYQIAFSILKNRENAEDIMQNVFVKIGKLSEDKLPSKYEASWLYSVTKNEAISFLRRNKETLPMEEYIKKEQEDEIDELMQKDAYEKMIDSLEQKEKQIVSLKVETGLSFKEIASLLNMPMGTVQWKYYKSLHNLKLLIGNLSLIVLATTLCITKFSAKGKKEQRAMEEMQESEKEVEQEENRKEEKDDIQETVIVKDAADSEKKSEAMRQESMNNEIMEITNTEEWQTGEEQRIENNEENKPEMMGGIVLVSSVILCLFVLFSIIFKKRQNRK